MSTTVLYIKSMVCPRCIESVSTIFREAGVEALRVELGTVALSAPLAEGQKAAVAAALEAQGFALLEDAKSQQINQIKALVIAQVHHKQEPLTVNFSTLISQQLAQEYSSLSKLFSSVEGITIEKFILQQKIEKVKELLCYNQMNLTQVAHQLGYSSVAHLSAQFKKETGMTPSQFKKAQPKRKSIDSL